MKIDMNSCLFALLGAALAYTGFCRAVLMRGNTTHLGVRHAFSAMTAAATAVMLSALFAPALLSWSLVALAGAFLVMQWVTSHLWSAGVPDPLRKR